MRANLFRLSAERHANADLARALRDRVTQDAVRSDRRQEERDAGENPREQRRRATSDKACRDARIHGAEVIDRQLRISRADKFPQRLGKRFRALVRARRGKDIPGVPIKERPGKPRLAPAVP